MESSISPSYESLMDKDDVMLQTLSQQDLYVTAARAAFSELRSQRYAEKLFRTPAVARSWWEDTFVNWWAGV